MSMAYWQEKNLLCEVIEWVFVQAISKLGTLWEAGEPLSLQMTSLAQTSRYHDFS